VGLALGRSPDQRCSPWAAAGLTAHRCEAVDSPARHSATQGRDVHRPSPPGRVPMASTPTEARRLLTAHGGWPDLAPRQYHQLITQNYSNPGKPAAVTADETSPADFNPSDQPLAREIHQRVHKGPGHLFTHSWQWGK